MNILNLDLETPDLDLDIPHLEIKHRKIDTSTGIFRFMSTRFTNKVNTAPKYNEGTPSKQRKYGIVKESKRKKGRVSIKYVNVNVLF